MTNNKNSPNTPKYKYLEHTADLKFEAYGETLEKLFQNASLAMFDVIVDTKKIQPNKTFNINVKGRDLEELLFEFLNELIFLLDAEFFLLNKVKSIKIQENNTYSLEAEFIGDINEGQYETYGSIKAVTFNDLKISKEDKHYKAIVVVDQ